MNLIFVLNSILLGVGLAMDAFSVSLANGLNEPEMKASRMNMVCFVYAFFQFAMPLAGWLCVHTLVEYFTSFQKFIPWIALALLLYIGIGMLRESFEESEEEENKRKLTFSVLIIQGIATSIDALSVGFTISDYNFSMALIACIIIAVVTHVICLFGLYIGKKAGTKLSSKASVLGGVILIAIGLEIFIRGVFF